MNERLSFIEACFKVDLISKYDTMVKDNPTYEYHIVSIIYESRYDTYALFYTVKSKE